AASHTGHLTGADAAFEGLFHQHGVTRVDDVDELAQFANAFAKLPRHLVPNLAIYGVSGGSNALATELAEQHQVNVPLFSDDTEQALHQILPSYLSTSNPVDNGLRFLMEASTEDRLRVLELIMDDPAIDV